MTATGAAGLDLTSFGRWLKDDAGVSSSADLSARLVAGGKSNLTYWVSDGTAEWAVRRPPLGHVLATAHDVAREHRVMAALDGTPVPVPKMVALCEDATVIGAPFLVMEWVTGTPYRSADDLAQLGARRVHAISTALVETLARLHAVVPADVGLSDLGRPDGFLERQVRRWTSQLEASRSRPLPLAERLRMQLLSTLPERPPTSSLVHGDYRLDNLLIDATDTPRAVVDWEMATLGDPLTDLGLLALYHRLGRLESGRSISDASMSPGFIDELELLDNYATLSGRDLSAFPFYLGLAAYKLAIILEGIHFRHVNGQTAGDGFDDLGDAVGPLLEIGLDALKG